MSNWHSTTLQEIISTIENGSRPKGGVRIGENSEGVPSYGGENISMNGGMLYDSVRMVPTSFATEMRRGVLSDKDVLINKDGANTGKSAIYRKPAGEEFATINEHLFLLRCKKGIAEQEFLYHFLNSEFGKSQITRVITGSAQPGLNSTFPEFIRIDLPPLPEQKRIAEILSGIDNLTKAVRERMYRLQIALDGLANSWETQLSIQGEEGMLGDLIDSIDSGWSPACEDFPPKSGEWGVLKVSAVTRGQFYEAESKRLPPDLPPREQFIVKKNDLLITRANGNLDLVGRGVIVSKEPDAKLLMSDKILRLNPRSNCDRNFLLLALNSRSVRQQIEVGVGGSTGAKNIGQGFLRQIAIAIPSSSEQVHIGNLSRSLSAALISTKRKFEHLVSLKKGLSSDLLSGRKRVSI
jgi:type I restriction enzyme S subunit